MALPLIGQVVKVGAVNAASMQPEAASWAGDMLDRVTEPCFIAAMGAHTKSLGCPLRGLTPVPGWTSGTKPVVIGLLALLNRNIVVRCSGLERAISPYFIAFVPEVRSGHPLRPKVALKGIGELVQLIPSRRALADPDLLRRDRKRLQEPGDLICVNRGRLSHHSPQESRAGSASGCHPAPSNALQHGTTSWHAPMGVISPAMSALGT
jgi:hypothetical protein